MSPDLSGDISMYLSYIAYAFLANAFANDSALLE